MKTVSVAVLAGDGIGPEVIAEGVKVLRAVEPGLRDLRFALTDYSVGAAEYLRSGDPLPPATLEKIRGHDAILLGAMGLPDVRWPDGLEMTPQIDLRDRLDLYGGLRPIRLYRAEDSPLRNAGQIDFLLIREQTEGLFSGRGARVPPDADEAHDRMTITRRGAERLFRLAFREARKRRKHVTLVDKANVLPSMAFFRRVFDDIAREFPNVRAEKVYVDACALYLVQRPQSFDVLVTENMFGDILSDLAAGLVGGMGMAPSADIGDKYGVFQPAHGSAPDIAGKGIANPVATILSVAMMLDWLGHPEAAARVRAATERVLSHPENRTRDLGGTLSTAQMGDLVAREAGAGDNP